MSWREATEADRPAVEAVLRARIETAMFPLGNLARHGMSGGHPRAMTFWIAGDPVEAALGVTGEGMVLPQLTPGRAGDAAALLTGRRIMGMAGETAQVRALAAALGLRPGEAEMDSDEPLLALDLADLRMPEVAGLALEPWSEARLPLLSAWRTAYGREAMGWGGDADARGAREAAAMVAGGQHRVLLRDGEPVAATGFNARLPGVVQVGGVWTPPPLRNRGLARAAVALHLAEARAEGVARAILFSASEAAARAYRAVGFAEVGRFALMILRTPREGSHA